MTLHIIRAGAIGASAQAVWNSRTGQLSGDPTIVHRAKRMKRVFPRFKDGTEPIDWTDESTAIAAVIDAAGSVYGRPVDHFAFPEEGDRIWIEKGAVSGVTLRSPRSVA
jgi:hypothetical protein